MSELADGMEQSLDINRMVGMSYATYFMRSASRSINEGIHPGSLLVVNCAAKPVHGSVVVAAVNGSYVMRRLLLRERPVLQHLDDLNDVLDKTMFDEQAGEVGSIFGVITHIISDARAGEFDDNPCM